MVGAHHAGQAVVHEVLHDELVGRLVDAAEHHDRGARDHAGLREVGAVGREPQPDLVERLPLFNAPASGYFGGAAEGCTSFTLAEAA